MIDHLLWAVPDLEEGCRRLAEATGVAAAPGGRHPGVGTHNALLGLGGERYLEIIALDPSQHERSGLGRWLEGVREPALLTWCARARGVEAVAAAARRAGLEPGEVVPMSRERPDGTRLEWRLLFVDGHGEGLLVPFFIEWGDGTVHPSRDAPGGCRLRRFVVRHPRPEGLGEMLAALGLEVEVEAASEPGLAAVLDTPWGAVELPGPPLNIAPPRS